MTLNPPIRNIFQQFNVLISITWRRQAIQVVSDSTHLALEINPIVAWLLHM